MTGIYYSVRCRLADHRDFGHALRPWLRELLDARAARLSGVGSSNRRNDQ